MNVAVYPGSFDPITFGHLDIAVRSSSVFDKVIIAVMVNPFKIPFFSIEQRVELIEESVSEITNIRVDSFEGLLVHYMDKIGAKVIIKGLRLVSDFESELQQATINKQMMNSIETFFMPTNTHYSYLSSSIVKEIAKHGGEIHEFVPAHVEKAVVEKLNK